jgi:hypothetical protein
MEWKQSNAYLAQTEEYMLYESKMLQIRDALIMKRADLKHKYQQKNNQQQFHQHFMSASAAGASILSKYNDTSVESSSNIPPLMK